MSTSGRLPPRDARPRQRAGGVDAGGCNSGWRMLDRGRKFGAGEEDDLRALIVKILRGAHGERVGARDIVALYALDRRQHQRFLILVGVGDAAIAA